MTLAATTLVWAGVSSADVSLTVVAHLVSDHVEHGVSMGDAAPAFAISAEVAGEHWFTGVSSYITSGDGDMSQATQLFVGYGFSLTEDLALELAVSHHAFSQDEMREWEYQDVRLDLHSGSNLAFTLIASDSLYGADAAAVLGEVSWGQDLGANNYWRLTAGHTFVERFKDISHASAVIGHSFGRWDMSLGFHYSDSDAAQIFDPDCDGGRVVVGLSYLLY